jgi:hypothetical protein
MTMPMGLSRLLALWLATFAVTAVALKALDRVPAILTGTPHGARVYTTMDQAEQALGTRIWLPGYYPDTLRWPPARIEADLRPPISVAVRIAGRDDGRERLVICESLGETPAAPPASLLPPGEILETARVALRAHDATLVRMLAPDGRIAHEVSWDQGSRRLTLRAVLAAEELLRIAASLERTGS